MKTYIGFFIATSAFAIPTKLTWNEKRYNQEMEPLKEEIQPDVNEFIKDGLFAFIFNSTYAEKQEFRDEFLNEINPEEISYLKNNIDFILNDDRNVRLNMQMVVIFILSVLLGVLLLVVFLLLYTFCCHSKKKEKLDNEKSPIMNSTSKPKWEPMGCMKANVQTKNGVECTMLYFKNEASIIQKNDDATVNSSKKF